MIASRTPFGTRRTRGALFCVVVGLTALLPLVCGDARAQSSARTLASGTDYAQIARSCRSRRPSDAGHPALANTPVTLRLLQSVTPVPATDGFIHLAYAAQVTNILPTTAVVQSITPVDALDGFKPTGKNSVIDTDDADITGKIRLFNRSLLDRPRVDTVVDFTRMPGGSSGVTFFDVRFKRANALPRLLSHRIAIQFGDPAQSVTTSTDPVVVNCQPLDVLVPPLTGSGWWNGNGCCMTVGPHRGATLPLNGDIRVPEVFAIDYVQLNDHNGCCRGPVTDLTSWSFFRAPILAAADGTVVEMENGLPEQIPGPPKGVTLANAAGNHIIEAIGGGHYILYAHLHTNSIPSRIKVNGRLRAGQQIGELGNTGSSTAPHLHFQVMDRPSALDASGLPFVFVAQQLEGTVIGTANAAEKAYESGQPVTVDRSRTGLQAFRMPAETQVFGYNLH